MNYKTLRSLFFNKLSINKICFIYLLHCFDFTIPNKEYTPTELYEKIVNLVYSGKYKNTDLDDWIEER